jgi:hypothetical protein
MVCGMGRGGPTASPSFWFMEGNSKFIEYGFGRKIILL